MPLLHPRRPADRRRRLRPHGRTAHGGSQCSFPRAAPELLRWVRSRAGDAQRDRCAAAHESVLLPPRPAPGQDYPIKSNGEIERFLGARRGQAFLRYFPLPFEEWRGGGLDRFEHWHIRVAGRYLRLPPGRWGRGAGSRREYQPFGGSPYSCFSRECVEYIDEFVRRSPSSSSASSST